MPTSTGINTWTWQFPPPPQLPPFTFYCNPTGITAPASACPALTTKAPIGTSAGVINADNPGANNSVFIGGAGANGGGSGTTNIGIGNFSTGVTTASGNIAVGFNVLGSATTGGANVGIGSNALHSVTTGATNIGIGNNAVGSIVTTVANTGIGNSVLNNATGNNNTAVGSAAGLNVTTGGGHTFLGVNAGQGITTGVADTIIGICSGFAAGLSNAVILCDGAGAIRYDWGLTTAATSTIAGPVRFNGGTPTIASGACGTGTNGTIAGDNQSGAITVGAAAAATCTVAFSAAMTLAPRACVWSAGNAAAAAVATAFMSAPTTGGFVLNATNLANGIYRYICI